MKAPFVGLKEIEGIKTVKAAVSELLLLSVALIVWVPEDEIGTVNIALEYDPFASVFIIAGIVEIVVPANFTEVMIEFPAYPVNENVTIVPGGPLAGVVIRLGITVNAAVTLLIPSVAQIGLTPAVSIKLIVVEKFPRGLAAAEKLVPSKLMVIVALSIKFEPDTTVDPTGPLTGFKFMLGVVTVKLTET